MLMYIMKLYIYTPMTRNAKFLSSKISEDKSYCISFLHLGCSFEEDLALKARMLYTPWICSTDPWNDCLPQDDENGKKMLADRHYYRLEYAAALEMYKELLGENLQGSVALKRDLTDFTDYGL